MRNLNCSKKQLLQRIEELEAHNQELKEQIISLSKLAALDDLTNLSNQRTLVSYLKSELDAATKRETPTCIALFDIDDFKKINDTMGHVYGNEVLCKVADIIQSNIRKTDLAGRYGGDEFMIVFTNTDLEDAHSIAERIRQSVEEAVFTGGVRITISGGLQQHNSEEFNDFINFADLNLYKAKKRGKDNIV